MGSVMLFTMFLSMAGGAYICYIQSRQVGWRYFLPKSLDELLHDRSVFDILVDVFIHQTMTKTLKRIGKPFWLTGDPEEAKYMLK